MRGGEEALFASFRTPTGRVLWRFYPNALWKDHTFGRAGSYFWRMRVRACHEKVLSSRRTSLEKRARSPKKSMLSGFPSASCHYKPPNVLETLAIEKAGETTQS